MNIKRVTLVVVAAVALNVAGLVHGVASAETVYESTACAQTCGVRMLDVVVATPVDLADPFLEPAESPTIIDSGQGVPVAHGYAPEDGNVFLKATTEDGVSRVVASQKVSAGQSFWLRGYAVAAGEEFLLELNFSQPDDNATVQTLDRVLVRGVI